MPPACQALLIGGAPGTPVSTASSLEQTKAFMATLRSNAKAPQMPPTCPRLNEKVADDMKSRTAPRQ